MVEKFWGMLFISLYILSIDKMFLDDFYLVS